MTKLKKKVFVGLSGGVDSSVSAALLKKEGYDVTGVFIKTWHPDFLPCTWKDERLDAMRVASALDIPFVTLDLEEEYKKHVADYMIAEYQKGRTPNPDVMCNKYVKFGAFYDYARKNGADFIATGHYARQEMEGSQAKMKKGVDQHKDQTYFLWTISQDILRHVLFPIGAYQKKEVRVLAESFALPTATKKDSQGVCFLGALNMEEFLAEFLPQKPGDVCDQEGKKIGTHRGAIFYTLGQRHGFTITEKTDNDEPQYVIGKDMEHNTITVSKDKGLTKESDTYSSCPLTEENWIDENGPQEKKVYDVRFRYRQELEKATFSREEGETVVHFKNLRERYALGQSLVVYDGEECLGGGVLSR